MWLFKKKWTTNPDVLCLLTDHVLLGGKRVKKVAPEPVMCGAVSPCSSAPETTFTFSTFKIIHSLCLDGQIRQQANRHIWMFFIKRCWSVQPCVDLCLHELQVTSRQEKAKGKRTLFFYVRKQRTCWFLLRYRLKAAGDSKVLSCGGFILFLLWLL